MKATRDELPPRLSAAVREKARKGQQVRRGGRELNAPPPMPKQPEKKKRRRRVPPSDPLKNVAREIIPVDSYEGFVCVTEDEESQEY